MPPASLDRVRIICPKLRGDILRDRLAAPIGVPKRTYKGADTGLFAIDPTSGNRFTCGSEFTSW